MTRRDNLVTITIPTAFSGIRGDQGNGFHRSTRLTPPINLIDTGQAAALRHKLIFEGRNLYDPERLAELGWTYYAIGRGASVSPVV